MLKNYFKIAWRNLVKDRLFSFIHISGLAFGMAVALLIGLVASPVAWFFATVLALFITTITISTQIARAALTNPSKV
jgi:hypothetical protein